MEKNTYREERSVAGLFSELTREMSSLVRHEVALAKAEMSEKAHQATTGVTSLAVGGMVTFASILVLLFSAVYALAQVVELWLAALIVGLIVLVVGVVMLQKGRSNLKAKNLVPHRTMKTMREDKSFAKDHIRST
ncbi:phage holin family protein [Desulfuromonas sp. TF]|uniref:phage holin family protein n=1 Tax=Desulfuromonas sp. TF TaxID=1232410 RepID=UPI000402DCE7|nr:phage holin family protein [Desulfuromonas sp. TF]